MVIVKVLEKVLVVGFFCRAILTIMLHLFFYFTSRAFTDDDDPMPSCDCYDDSQEGIDDEMPEHFHFHSSESGQMFSHFDDMFRSFDELFRSMGMTQFSAVEPGERNLNLHSHDL